MLNRVKSGLGRRINVFYWLMVVSFVVPASSLAEKVTADKVIQNCVDSYEKQMKGIKDITIVTNRNVTYQKWVTTKGKTICKTRCEMEVMGKKVITLYDGVYQWLKDPSGKVTKQKIDYDPYQTIENLKTTPAKYGGSEKIDGHKTHILNIKDITKLMGYAEREEKEKVKVTGKIWVDAKDWVLRKMEMDIKGVDEKGKKKTTKITTEMKDFRRVNGMFIPYRTVSRIIVGGEARMSAKDEQEMRESLAQMEEQLKKMSPGERAMAERMMKPQMEMMKKMLAGRGTETITVVKDVKINAGLSDTLFDGRKLK